MINISSTASLHSTRWTSIALAGALLAGGAALAAAQPTPDPHHPPGQPDSSSRGEPAEAQSGMGLGMSEMMGMMRPMGSMGQGGMASMSCMSVFAMPDRIEGWLAFLHTELKITDEQTQQWSSFSNRLKASAKMFEAFGPSRMMGPAAEKNDGTKFLQKLNRQEEALKARLGLLGAYRDLYQVLSPEQKATAEELLAPHMNMSGGPH